MNYIISLKNTKKGDRFLTFWRPNDKGYTTSVEAAGKYRDIIPGYHDTADNLILPVNGGKAVFLEYAMDVDSKFMGVLTCKSNLKQLGLEWSKGRLSKMKPNFEAPTP